MLCVCSTCVTSVCVLFEYLCLCVLCVCSTCVTSVCVLFEYFYVLCMLCVCSTCVTKGEREPLLV